MPSIQRACARQSQRSLQEQDYRCTETWLEDFSKACACLNVLAVGHDPLSSHAKYGCQKLESTFMARHAMQREVMRMCAVTVK